MSESDSSAIKADIGTFMQGLRQRNPGETEFHQAVQESARWIIPFCRDHPKYSQEHIFERMTEPDRVVIFPVSWEDRHGEVQVNRAWRVQFNNAIGPYKGGMRFHPTVSLSILKFLGFEQVFKNSLTGLPMGGAKGGANFDPKGKTDHEVMRFCHSLMLELSRHIGKETDVPAGDIGVGSREIGYMFGMYKRMTNRFVGVLTGKGLAYGGSPGRVEATGYGSVFFMREMLATRGDGLQGKTAVVSGAGNVALHCTEKLIELGARVVTVSDSDGFVHDPDGIDEEKLAWLKDLKFVRRGRIHEYADAFGCDFHAGQRPWAVPCELAFPSATQNELDSADARTLLDNGLIAVSEGANMPTELGGVEQFLRAGILFGPAKAANAGGVTVSGLEQSQNAVREPWKREDVLARLDDLMKLIHSQCVEYGQERGRVNYVKGANIAGFVKVADAMLAYGIV